MVKDATNTAAKPDDTSFLAELDGFQSVNPISGPQTWAKFEVGNIYMGDLVGRFKLRKADRKGNPRYYYQIKLTRPCSAFKKIEGEDGEEVSTEIQMKVGDIICVDEKAALIGLQQCVEKMELGAKFQVYIKVEEKKDIGDGQTYWACDVRSKLITG